MKIVWIIGNKKVNKNKKFNKSYILWNIFELKKVYICLRSNYEIFIHWFSFNYILLLQDIVR